MLQTNNNYYHVPTTENTIILLANVNKFSCFEGDYRILSVAGEIIHVRNRSTCHSKRNFWTARVAKKLIPKEKFVCSNCILFSSWSPCNLCISVEVPYHFFMLPRTKFLSYILLCDVVYVKPEIVLLGQQQIRCIILAEAGVLTQPSG